jgi:hypothetical protein
LSTDDDIPPGVHHLGSLGDLVEFLIDGWRIEAMHYADRSGPGGSDGAPAAFFDLTRGGGERYRICIPDDGRTLSHRALVTAFRERPQIWKHRSPASIPLPDADAVRPVEEWGPVPEPFPAALEIGPRTLRGVVGIHQIQTIDGTTIALTHLERHTDAALARFIVDVPDGGHVEARDLLVIDDVGRMYEAASLACRTLPGGVDCAIAIAPQIPADARTLTLTVGTLELQASERVDGPWVFPVPLSRPS